MDIFSHIVEIIFVLLFIAIIVTMFKYPRDVFVNLPAGFLKIIAGTFLRYIKLFTSPIWLPIWFLDEYYKWGIFDHKFFRIFEAPEIGAFDEYSEPPDTTYSSNDLVPIDFNAFEKFLISSNNDIEKFEKVLLDGMESLNKEFTDIKTYKVGKLSMAKVTGTELYDFNYLIQWLENEFKNSRNYGFAKHTDFSFFGMDDPKTLNNIVGKTSEKQTFAFSLISGNFESLAIIEPEILKTRYSTSFFNKLTNDTQRVTSCKLNKVSSLKH